MQPGVQRWDIFNEWDQLCRVRWGVCYDDWRDRRERLRPLPPRRLVLPELDPVMLMRLL